MRRAFQAHWKIFLFVVLIAWILRVNVYSVKPYSDEETYDWLAYNLSQGRMRTGSSFMDVYARFGSIISGGEVEPWLDHPVLYPVILSIPKMLSQKIFNADLTFYSSRIISILIFCLPTIYLVMVITKKEFGLGSAVISGLIYAAVPSIILQQKMLFLDHGVSLFSMLSLYAIIKYLDSESSKWWILSSVFAGMASLCKGTGVSTIFASALAITFISQDQFRKRLIRGFLSFVIGASIFSIYPLYGLLLNYQLFLAVVSSQLSIVSPEWLVRTMFEQPWSFQKGFYDGFLVLGWEAFAYIIFITFRKKQFKISLLWLTCYLLFLIVVVKHTYYYSQIVIYPFLTIFLGKMFIDILKKLRSLFTIPD